HRPPQGSRSRRAHHPPGARRQPVPLHRLPQHRQGDRGGCESHEGVVAGRVTSLGSSAPRRRNKGTTSMYEFKYHRPTTVRQAANLLAKDDDAKILAGGHSLLPTMKLRLAKPSQIIDIGRIEGLNTIELKGRSIVIGAMA